MTPESRRHTFPETLGKLAPEMEMAGTGQGRSEMERVLPRSRRQGRPRARARARAHATHVYLTRRAAERVRADLGNPSVFLHYSKVPETPVSDTPQKSFQSPESASRAPGTRPR